MLPIYDKMFNLILETGIIPQHWYKGVIIPIYKNKGDPTPPNNYRPITLLFCESNECLGMAMYLFLLAPSKANYK